MKPTLLLLCLLTGFFGPHALAQDENTHAIITYEGGVISIEMRGAFFSGVKITGSGSTITIEGTELSHLLHAGNGTTQAGPNKVQVSAGPGQNGIRAFNTTPDRGRGVRFLGDLNLGSASVQLVGQVGATINGTITSSSGNLDFGVGAFFTHLADVTTDSGSVTVRPGGHVLMVPGAKIESTGSGDITLHGGYIRDSFSGPFEFGALSKIVTHDGDISLTADSGGVSLITLIESTGDGSIEIAGKSSDGSGSGIHQAGVRILRDAVATREAYGAGVFAKNGSIKITGEGLTYGIELRADVRVQPENPSEVGDGITLIGKGGSSWDGIYVSPPRGSHFEDAIVISSLHQDISITGSGSDSTSSSSHSGGIKFGEAKVIGEGRANIAITGNGARGGSDNKFGIFFDSSTTVFQTESGDISVTALAEPSATGNSEGISGAASITIDSTAGGDIAILTRGSNPSVYDFITGFGSSNIGSSETTGDIRINADSVKLDRMTLQSTGELHINPRTPGRNVIIDGVIPFSNLPHPDLATALILRPSELRGIEEGFSLIQIGTEPTFDSGTNQQTGGIGTVTLLDAPEFNSSVNILANNIEVESIDGNDNVIGLLANNKIKNIGSGSPHIKADSTVFFTSQIEIDGFLNVNGDLGFHPNDSSDNNGVLKLSIDSAGESGSSYDQIRILEASKKLSLNSFLLDLEINESYEPAAGDQFKLVDLVESDASIEGLFHRSGTGGSLALEEGSNIVIDEKEFTISYQGGDGNDVILTFEGDGELIAQCQPSFDGALFNEIDPQTGTAAAFLSIVADHLDAGSSSPAGIASRTVSPAAGLSCADVGSPKAFTLLVEDNAGATASCSTTINAVDILDLCAAQVVDDEDPVARCESEVVLRLDEQGMATLDASQVDSGSSDNVSIASFFAGPSQYTCQDVGSPSVASLLVTDSSGNSDNCSTNVKVLNSFDNVCGLDDEPPVAECRDIDLQITDEGFASLSAAMVNNGSTDNVGITDLSVDRGTFFCRNVGQLASVFLTVEDQVGNTASCTSYVTIRDDNTDACATVIPEDENAETEPEIISGRAPEGSLLDNVTVTEDGVIEESLVSGRVESRGTIRDSRLLPYTELIGGRVTGVIRGTGDNPDALPRINAFIDGASLENVLIGKDAVVDPRTIIGRGVRFEKLQNLPENLDLTNALNEIPADNIPLPAVDLGQSLQAPGSEEMTLLRSIQLIDAFEPAGFDVNQDSANGELFVNTIELSARLLPVIVRQASPNAEQTIGFNADGDVSIVNATQQEVVSFPLVGDDEQLRQSAGELFIGFDERANIVVENLTPGLDSRAVGRPSVGAVTAPLGRKPGIDNVPHNELKNINLVSFVFEDENGQLVEQKIVPVPADWLALKAALQSVSGARDVRISSEGVISLFVDGAEVRALADYEVRRGPNTGANDVQFLPAGDLNGDGIGDIEILYANGDKQFAFGML